MCLPVFVGNEECAPNVAAIWIFTFAVENFLIFIEVVQIDSTIECQQNDLRCLEKKVNKQYKTTNK